LPGPSRHVATALLKRRSWKNNELALHQIYNYL
jgi:hypothetical protein